MTQPPTPKTRQAAFSFDWPQSLHPDHYVVTDCNQTAFDAVSAPQNWTQCCLVVQGARASGKTHLCQIFIQATGAVNLSHENLGQPHWQRYRAFVLDNADNYIGQDVIYEEALFHLYNAAKANNDKLLITTTKPLNDLSFILPDLQSRLVSSPVVTLEQPDDVLLQAVYMKLFADRQLAIKPDVIDYIIDRTERSFSAIQQLVQQLDQWALGSGKPITIPVVRHFLQDTTPS